MAPSSICSISEHDINLLQGKEEQFTAFVNDLICATMLTEGKPKSSLVTNLRTKAMDGGVDTEVREPVRDADGWLEVPTIWQFKPEPHSGITKTKLTEEILGKLPPKKKTKSTTKAASKGSTATPRYITERLCQSYGYRLCVSDSITPEKIKTWEDHLDGLIRKIEPNAPPPRVVAAGMLARWANRFSGIIVKYFKSLLADMMPFEPWDQRMRAVTKVFVPIPSWKTSMDRVRAHIDVSQPVDEPVLTVRGLSGVGKTRMVHEAVRALAPLVIYTDDSNAAEAIAQKIARESEISAIVIADECPLNVALRLNERVRGNEARVRIVTIDNSGDRSIDRNEIWLEKMLESDLENVLEKNFSTVNPNERMQYAEWARGYPRLAADLCKNARRIAGPKGAGLSSTETYVKARLSHDLLETIKLVSLVHLLGWNGDMGKQLVRLCSILKLDDVAGIRKAIRTINQKTGFIAVAGNYCYVTPEIVAEIAFAWAYEELIQPDEERILGALPNDLVDAFLKRVHRSAREEVRVRVGDFFRGWARTLTPAALRHREHAERLTRLAEIDPILASILREIIEGASLDELRDITGAYQHGGWGPRRALVWYAEGAAAFTERFDDAEIILRRLALAESEPGIGNNATAIWMQLFRIQLSGTAIDFEQRLDRLSRILFGDDTKASKLAARALEHILEPLGHVRRVGPAIIAGHKRPLEWNPRSRDELRACRRQAAMLLVQMAEGDPSLAEIARKIAAKRALFLLQEGLLDALRQIFVGPIVAAGELPELLDAVDRFLSRATRAAADDAYVEEIKHWRSTLVPPSLHGRLLEAVGRRVPHDKEMYTTWRAELAEIGRALLREPRALEAELPFLFSAEARSAMALGDEMGAADTNARCLETILHALADKVFVGFAQGYALGLLRKSPQHTEALNAHLDRLAESVPAKVLDMAMMHPRELRAARRVLRIVEEGRLGLEHLDRLETLAWRGDLADEDLARGLKMILAGGAEREVEMADLGLRIVEAYVEADRAAGPFEPSEELMARVWDLLEAAVNAGASNTTTWEDLLKKLGQREPPRAIDIACKGLAHPAMESTHFHEPAEEVLVSLSGSWPDEVMHAVGEAILDEERGVLFYVGRYRKLIQGLPLDRMKAWLTSKGKEAARRIARHLAEPYLDENEKPVVPELTAFVLESFASDRRVFEEFCAGVHSFQLYVGDIAAEHEREAEVARHFLAHRLRRVREWAEKEIRSSRARAEHERELEEIRKAG